MYPCRLKSLHYFLTTEGRVLKLHVYIHVPVSLKQYMKVLLKSFLQMDGGEGGSLVRLNPELAICSFSWGRGVLHLLNNPPKQIHHWCLPAVSNNGRHARIKKKISWGSGSEGYLCLPEGWGLRPTFLVILLCKFKKTEFSKGDLPPPLDPHIVL